MGFRRMLPHVKPKGKGGWLRYRRRIPQEFVEALGKNEHIKDLGTRCYKEAEPLAQIENEVWLRLIKGAELNAGTSRTERMKVLHDLQSYGLAAEAEDIDPFIIAELREKTAKLLDAAIKQGVKHSMAEGDSLTDYNPRPKAIEKTLTELVKKLRLYEQMYREKGFEPSKYLKGKHNKLTIPAHEQGKLANVLRIDLPLDSEFVDTKAGTPKLLPKSKAKTLQYAYEAWKSVRNPSVQAATEWKRAIKLFEEYHGKLALHHITKQHVKEFREAIRKIPSRLPRKQLQLTLPELLKLESKGKLEGTPRTAGAVNKLVVALSAMFDVMCNEDVMESNPAKGLLLKAEDSTRLPYTIDDLNTLFHSSVYAKPFAITDEYPSRFWLPLLALYTGARIGELSQATVKDIITKGDVVYLSINKQDGKRLKSKSSLRDVPLHSQLLQCGFIRYVEHRKKQGAKQLFPDLTFSKHGGYTSNFSNWYGRYCKDIGLNDPNKVFHSFRHSFKDACREAGIPKDVHDRLTGHASADVGSSYGLGYTVEKLNQYVQRIEYKELGLMHLLTKTTSA